MSNDYAILSMFIVFGTLIMFGYSRMFLASPEDQSKLWSNKSTNNIEEYGILRIYQIMIFLSLIVGLYLVVYLTMNPAEKEENVIIRYIGVSLFLLFSFIWAIKPFLYSKFVLFMVVVGIVLILVSIANECIELPDDAIAITAASILVIQTFVFDYILWTGIL